MNIKSFIKDISIYGILPVTGKFIGFFLVPIYARVFSAYEFGVVELIVTLIQFLTFVCNLEFYGAIGRFFYDRESVEDKKKLISTGLFLTLFFTTITSVLVLLNEKHIIDGYLEGGDYQSLLRFGVVWMVLSAVYTYLGIIPRFEKKPKTFVTISTISLLIRVSSTIFFVLILKTGIIGVIYGHISGSFASTIMNGVISAKYIGFKFDLKEAKAITKFSLPLAPGLLLIGMWNPLSRSIIANYFSIQVVGLFSFAARITSILMILNQAINFAWKPILFESYKNDKFKEDFKRISTFSGLVAFYGVLILILTSPEISLYIGTKEYAEAYILVGFLALRKVFEVLAGMRGFGPLISNKTYILTGIEILCILVGVALLMLFQDKVGLMGIGIAFVVPAVIKYLFLTSYTKKYYHVTFIGKYEYLLIAISIIGLFVIHYYNFLLIRYALLAMVSSVSFLIFCKNRKATVK